MEIKPVLILESNHTGLMINESASNPKSDLFILSGPFTEFDIKNRNDRIYTKEKFLPHLNELNERMKQLGVIYGEFDHPDAFDISLSRISHVVETAIYVEKTNRVEGSIRLLNTHYGKEAKELVRDNCPLFVSSRAAGVTESNGEVTIKKLFTYDAVADPGFASARMEIKSLNESLGFNESANFRIYDMSDESKINNLFEMNHNDVVTQKQFIEYSEYLKEELSNIKTAMDKNIIEGRDPESLEKLTQYYDTLMENYNKMSKYLDYLAEHLQIAVSENEQLRATTEKLIEHNDYLAETLEHSINYSKYLATTVDKNIDYVEYIAEGLDKSIDFSEYLAENVEKSIKYSEYLGENLDKNIDYAEYLAENVDKTIDYSEYIAENTDSLSELVDNSVKYAEYLAEHVDNNINYSQYIAEHVDNDIQFSEYIAENLSDNQAYSKYIAESLDKTIDNFKNSKLISENIGEDDQRISDLKVANIDKYYDDDDDEMDNDDLPEEISDVNDNELDSNPVPQSDVQPVQSDEELQAEPVEPVQPQAQPQAQPVQSQSETTLLPGTIVTVQTEDGDKEGEIISFNIQDGFAIVKLNDIVQSQEEIQDEPVQGQPQAQPQVQGQPQAQPQAQGQPVQSTQTQAQEIRVHESKITVIGDKVFESEKSIKNSISQLISEAKKRKAAEEYQPHFLLFLTEKNKTVWNDLSIEDKEKVIIAMNERNYTSERDVLNVIREALDSTSKTEEEILIESIPTDLFKIWESLSDKSKKGVLAQAKFYSNLTSSKEKMISFWNSRGLDKISTDRKILLNEKKQYVNDVKISDSEIDRYINVFKNL